MIALALALQIATAPSAEAVRLGTEIARSGTFSQVAPMVAAEQTEELVRATPDLTATEQAVLRATAAETARRGVERITAEMGLAYATALSIADMQTVLAFAHTDAARKYRAAEPNAMAAAVKGMGGMDFKGDVMKAFCGKTGKGCATK